MKPEFRLAFNIGRTNEERISAFELYQRALGAKKISEAAPPEGDIHIVMEISGMKILLAPGGLPGTGLDNAIVCELDYDDEQAFEEAYHALRQEGPNASMEGPYPWADRLGLVTDKFGIGWALYYHHK